jgi:hypothetical protein
MSATGCSKFFIASAECRMNKQRISEKMMLRRLFIADRGLQAIIHMLISLLQGVLPKCHNDN